MHIQIFCSASKHSILGRLVHCIHHPILMRSPDLPAPRTGRLAHVKNWHFLAIEVVLLAESIRKKKNYRRAVLAVKRVLCNKKFSFNVFAYSRKFEVGFKLNSINVRTVLIAITSQKSSRDVAG